MDHGRFHARGPRERGEAPYIGSFATAEEVGLVLSEDEKENEVREKIAAAGAVEYMYTRTYA